MASGPQAQGARAQSGMAEWVGEGHYEVARLRRWALQRQEEAVARPAIAVPRDAEGGGAEMQRCRDAEDQSSGQS
jgi:hypothetical protein